MTRSLDQAGMSLLGKDLDLRSATRRRKCFICSLQVTVIENVCTLYTLYSRTEKMLSFLQDARQSVSGSAHENCDPCLINY